MRLNSTILMLVFTAYIADGSSPKESGQVTVVAKQPDPASSWTGLKQFPIYCPSNRQCVIVVVHVSLGGMYHFIQDSSSHC
jgi:hypothetical protein